MIVLVVNCFLARFRGQPGDREKRGTHEKEIQGSGRETQSEWEGERGGVPNSSNGRPGLKWKHISSKLATGSDWLKETQADGPLKWTCNRKQEKKVSQTMKMWRWAENTAPILGELHKRVSTPASKMWRQNLSSYNQELQQKTRKITSRSVSASLTLWQFIFLWLSKVGDSFFILGFSFFFDNYEWEVANKLCIKWTYSRRLCVCHFFLWQGKKQGSNQNIRHTTYTQTILNGDITRLCDAVVL